MADEFGSFDFDVAAGGHKNRAASFDFDAPATLHHDEFASFDFDALTQSQPKLPPRLLFMRTVHVGKFLAIPTRTPRRRLK